MQWGPVFCDSGRVWPTSQEVGELGGELQWSCGPVGNSGDGEEEYAESLQVYNSVNTK